MLSHDELLLTGTFRGRQLLALTVGNSVHDHVFLLSLAGSSLAGNTKQRAKQLQKFEILNLFVRYVVTHAADMLARERPRCDYNAVNLIVNLISNLTSTSFLTQICLDMPCVL